MIVNPKKKAKQYLKYRVMNKFIKEMMHLGACEERCCSQAERESLIKDAEKLYTKHLARVKGVLPRLLPNDIEIGREALKYPMHELYFKYGADWMKSRPSSVW